MKNKKHLTPHAMMWAKYREEQARRRIIRIAYRVVEIHQIKLQGVIRVVHMTPPTKFRFNDCLEIDVVHNNYYDIKQKKRGVAPNITKFITEFFNQTK